MVAVATIIKEKIGASDVQDDQPETVLGKKLSPMKAAEILIKDNDEWVIYLVNEEELWFKLSRAIRDDEGEVHITLTDCTRSRRWYME